MRKQIAMTLISACIASCTMPQQLADHADHIGKGLYCADVATNKLTSPPDSTRFINWVCWQCRYAPEDKGKPNPMVECRRTDLTNEYRPLAKLQDLKDEELFYLSIEELMEWQEKHLNTEKE